MNPDTKRKVLQLFPSPIFVVGCAHEGEVHAFGGSWMGQCSFDPPILWIGVRKDSRAHSLLDLGRPFTINILSAEQVKVARVFFKPPTPTEGRFGTIPFHLSPLGAPILNDCQAWAECVVRDKASPGDHTLFFGHLTDCGLNGAGAVLTTVSSGMKYGG